jgi:transcriptional regulator with XRE-family HTH domain
MIPYIGAKIRQNREARGMALRELARRLGLSAAYVSDLELGRRTASDETLQKIAKELEVEVDQLGGEAAQ